MALKGNKGEWSEFYTFLKLLADGKLYTADENLNKNEEIFYLILKIIRSENGNLNYLRKDKIIVQNDAGEILSEIPIQNILKYTESLLAGMNSGEGAFSLDFMTPIFNELYATRLSDEKVETADIRIVIHDPVLHNTQTQGFSIKSYLGGKPTLFNASKNTNLIYKILPEINYEQVIEINLLDSYSKRINWLTENGFNLEFVKMQSEIFKTNLQMIDSNLPVILSDWLLKRYLSRKSSVKDLTDYLSISNPCDFKVELNPNFYCRKIKDMLVDMALGMQAGRIWNGNFNVTGGFIAVKKDGELVCYHVYNRNEFQNYLLNHTKVDFPDSSPNRCDYGRIITAAEVVENEGYFIKLNFQIRFK
ncbi:MAG: hypothetical protein A2X64_01090 [Ignavibacteria bacterium GWF2_33_9]|nr:MAG: hypothetical protein A2X64_01090 [Ignavibacteria bacterium GWF2_33_9]